MIASWVNDDTTWWAEFRVSPVDDWREDGYGEPAFGAGLSFDHYRRQVQWPPPLESSSWVRELNGRGISVGQTDQGPVGRCFRTLYLSEVMSRGTDLDEQAAFVARWAEESVREIASLTPPPITDSESVDATAHP